MEETATLLDLFINLSAEYPAILDMVLIFFGAVGVIISSSAVFDIMRMGHQNKEPGTARRIGMKLIGGTMMIDLAFWVNTLTETIWSYSSPLGIDGYVVNSASGDAWTSAQKAIIGFLMLTGYVTLGRAYYSITRLGYLNGEARADLIPSIFSRIVAGSALIASQHVASMLGESTGFNWITG